MIILVTSLYACSSGGWSEQDKKEFIKDCLASTQEIENAEKICDCGLQKSMELYRSKAQAEQAVQNMSQNEILKLYEDCVQ